MVCQTTEASTPLPDQGKRATSQGERSKWEALILWPALLETARFRLSQRQQASALALMMQRWWEIVAYFSLYKGYGWLEVMGWVFLVLQKQRTHMRHSCYQPMLSAARTEDRSCRLMLNNIFQVSGVFFFCFRKATISFTSRPMHSWKVKYI